MITDVAEPLPCQNQQRSVGPEICFFDPLVEYMSRKTIHYFLVQDNKATVVNVKQGKK